MSASRYNTTDEIVDIPPFHVGFNIEEILKPDTPWLAWSRFKHESTELRMEGRCRPRVSARSQMIWTQHTCREGRYCFSAPRTMSGTPPPCFNSSASLAKAARISACRKESLTSFFSSSKVTTRYSICEFDLLADRPSKDISESRSLTSSPHKSASRSLPFARRHMASNCFGPLCQSPFIRSQWPMQSSDFSKLTSIPHSRTWSATFLASGHSNGVPTALKSRKIESSAHARSRGDGLDEQEAHASRSARSCAADAGCRTAGADLIAPRTNQSVRFWGMIVVGRRSPIQPKVESADQRIIRESLVNCRDDCCTSIR